MVSNQETPPPSIPLFLPPSLPHSFSLPPSHTISLSHPPLPHSLSLSLPLPLTQSLSLSLSPLACSRRQRTIICSPSSSSSSESSSLPPSSLPPCALIPASIRAARSFSSRTARACSSLRPRKHKQDDEQEVALIRSSLPARKNKPPQHHLTMRCRTSRAKLRAKIDFPRQLSARICKANGISPKMLVR